MISANMRTEELLQQSQSLTQELQSQSKELTQQQDELKRTNSALEKQALELEEKARLLAEQNTKVEVKNREVEQARVSLEEKAEQLALISKYKSEFLANMSHELRTPLNSLLILAKLLSDNAERNLLRQAGRVREDDLRVGRRSADADQRDPRPVQGRGRQDAGRAARASGSQEVADFVERSFRPVADQKDLEFTTEIGPRPAVADPHRPAAAAAGAEEPARQRVQVHRRRGGVTLRVQRARPGTRFEHERCRSRTASSRSRSPTPASASRRTSRS